MTASAWMHENLLTEERRRAYDEGRRDERAAILREIDLFVGVARDLAALDAKRSNAQVTVLSKLRAEIEAGTANGGKR